MGATWTLELRSVHDAGSPDAGSPDSPGPPGPSGAAQPGPVVEWICSGLPTELPAPDDQTVDVLGERGLLLFPEIPQAPTVSEPRTRCRRMIGYVTRDPQVMRLALLLAEQVDAGPVAHPMVLAARWIDAGYSVDAAQRWVAAGIIWPGVAQHLLATELEASR